MTDTILVTGGAGFIGSRLSLRLASSGKRVRVLDNLSPQIHGDDAVMPQALLEANIECVRGSVTNRKDWESALDGVSHVAHLAAETGTGQSMYEIERYTHVNSVGTALLFDVLAQSRGHKIERVVLTSSRSIYGEGRYGCGACGLSPQFPESRSAHDLSLGIWDPPCTACGAPLLPEATQEVDASQPASIYAASKLAQEHLVSIACKSQNISPVILRLQNVYGEGQSLKNPYTGILSIFTTKLRHGTLLPLFEDGRETRDFVHVDDVVSCLERSLDFPKAAGQVINVGSGVGTSVADVASELRDAIGAHSEIRVTGEYRLGDIRHNFADISKMRELLDFTPQVSLRTGLKGLVDWACLQELHEDRLDQANSELRERGLMAS